MTAMESWIWPVAAAPFIGSFLGVLIMRAEAPASIVFGRSHCPQCNTPLGAADLLPLVSWAMSRGRCRHCGGKIASFYPAVELAALAIALWSAMLASGWVLWVSCGFGWALLALAWIDQRYFLLPDFLTLPLIPAGLAVNWAFDPESLPDHLAGAAVGFLFVMLLRYAYSRVRHREGIGLGDAKLLAAAGAWVSWTGLPSVLLIASLTGLAAVLSSRLRDPSVSLTDRVPFGMFLCFGIWIVWLYGPFEM